VSDDTNCMTLRLLLTKQLSTMPPGPVSDDRAIGGALAAACRELRPSEIAAVYEDQREVSQPDLDFAGLRCPSVYTVL